MKSHFNPTPSGYLSALRERRTKHARRLKFITSVVMILTIVTLYGNDVVKATLALAQEAESEEYYEEDYFDYDYITEEGCNVLGISLYGELGTYADGYAVTTSNSIRSILEDYGTHENIKAILVDVDSEGGSAVAGDEILHLLEEQTIPVVAQVRDLGASAAYLAILSADRIFAHPYGSVGSIGVISTFYDYSEYNQREGIKYDPIQSSPSKDAGTQERPLTKKERAMFQAEVDYIYDGFVNTVAQYRNLSREKVLQLGDGTTYLGATARDAGLIDEVGGSKEVYTYIENQINDSVRVCWINEAE